MPPDPCHYVLNTHRHAFCMLTESHTIQKLLSMAMPGVEIVIFRWHVRDSWAGKGPTECGDSPISDCICVPKKDW